MNLANISVSDFTKIAKLLKAKDALLAKVADIDAELSAFESGGKPGKRGPTPGRQASGPRAKRGALKEIVVGLLKGAGKEGMSVKDIAAKAGVKSTNVHAWFFTTGKKIKEIKKTGKSVYSWVE